MHETFSYFLIPIIEQSEYSDGGSRVAISLIAWQAFVDSVIGVHWAGQDDNESSGGRYKAASGQTSRHSSDSFGGVGGVVVVVSAGVVTFLGQRTFFVIK